MKSFADCEDRVFINVFACTLIMGIKASRIFEWNAGDIRVLLFLHLSPLTVPIPFPDQDSTIL